VTEPIVNADPEAPYGRFKNGKPRKHPPKNTSSAPRRSRAKTKGPSYTEAVHGMFQMVALPLTFVNPADAWTINQHAGNIAVALNDLAQERPEVAAMLDRMLKAGPYGALVAACVPMICQLLTNHKLLPPGILGTVPKEQIEEQLRQEAAQMQQMFAEMVEQNTGE